MRVIFWGTYDTGKPRTRILREAIRNVGIELEEIHAPVWAGVEDKSQVQDLSSRLRLLLGWVLAYPALIVRLARARKPDLILVGYPGIVDVFVAWPIARLRGVPLAWDVFLSAYDTIVEDRRLLVRSGIAARLLRWIERAALHRVDVMFMDTHAHARRVESLFDLEPGRCDRVWVGVEDRHFTKAAAPAPKAAAEPMRVLFYGQFIPLHGIGTIIEAAALLRDEAVEWTLVGRGQEAARIRAQLTAARLPRVHWIDWVEYAELGQWIAGADLCLGIFGTSGKAASVIPNKVFQIVAAGKPLVTRDSPAIRELLAPSTPCTYLVPAGDAAALGAAVSAHRRALGEGGGSPARCHPGIASRIDAAAIGAQFLELIQRRLDLR